MAAVFLPLGSIMKWSGTDVTEHNRASIRVSNEHFEGSHRALDGSMRKFFITKKKTFSTSWELVPNLTTKTVDAKMGADAMKAFYDANVANSFVLTIVPGNTAPETYTVVFQEFSYEVIKRGAGYDQVNVTVTLEEV